MYILIVTIIFGINTTEPVSKTIVSSEGFSSVEECYDANVRLHSTFMNETNDPNDVFMAKCVEVK